MVHSEPELVSEAHSACAGHLRNEPSRSRLADRAPVLKEPSRSRQREQRPWTRLTPRRLLLTPTLWIERLRIFIAMAWLHLNFHLEYVKLYSPDRPLIYSGERRDKRTQGVIGSARVGVPEWESELCSRSLGAKHLRSAKTPKPQNPKTPIELM
jgi:hypothetical protein